MSRWEDAKGEREQGTGNVGWFLAGVAAGLLISLLFAPKAGRDTRELLSQLAQSGRDAVTGTSRDVLERGREMYEQGRQLVTEAAELFERGRKLVRG